VYLRNLEKIDEFYIAEDWHKNRKKGVSAMLRLKDEEEFIKPCLLSIKDFFDEIVVTLNNCTDRTPQIIAELNLPQVKVFDYPFRLHHNGPGHNRIPENSIHDNSYFYNWTLNKTSFQHVCKWDGDMVALPTMNKRVKRTVCKSNVVRIAEFNIAGDELTYLSKETPLKSEPRFFRVDEHTFYKQGDICEYFDHGYKNKVLTIDEPVCLHFKNAKSIVSATKSWPDNWEEIELFRQLHERRARGGLYRGVLPEALKEKILCRAFDYARIVEVLGSQEEVMRTIGSLLFRLRNNNIKGDIVEIGSKRGKTTVFLSRIMETFFPGNKVYSIDPYTVAGATKSLHLEDNEQIYEIYNSFISNTSTLTNHIHFKMPSIDSESVLPDTIIFSLIDGEHTYEGVKNDFKIVVDKTIDGGIIAIDDFKNDSWPEVKRAYEEILSNYGVECVHQDCKVAYLMKKPTLTARIKESFRSATTA